MDYLSAAEQIKRVQDKLSAEFQDGMLLWQQV